jgi:hypothetical protein
MSSIVFSRHARRRMRLYRIDPERVVAAIRTALGTLDEPGERHAIVSHEFLSEHGYPLKAVFVREGDTVTVVTAYPLKKERKP